MKTIQLLPQKFRAIDQLRITAIFPQLISPVSFMCLAKLLRTCGTLNY
jgi:hypothetical protein